MSDPEILIVECSIHGKNEAAFVCQHLVNGENVGFNYSYDSDDPDALFPDAWCDACDDVLDEEGEWNERTESFIGITPLCCSCYEISRARNWSQDDDKYTELLTSSIEYLEEKQDEFIRKFKIDEHPRWDVDQESGKLIFSNEGVPQVEADIQYVGTISTQSDTWLWAWANDSLSENVKHASREIRDMGEQSGFLKLAAAHWPASKGDGWEMTAIMAKALHAIGAYCARREDGFTFMIINDAKWVHRENNVTELFR